MHYLLLIVLYLVSQLIHLILYLFFVGAIHNLLGVSSLDIQEVVTNVNAENLQSGLLET